ncbi:MAG: hypothetical protein IT386_14855 [Deltaproteobacteria bacterium]|nr:hypothetical protein [Deltaproteobacteria bacterium]
MPWRRLGRIAAASIVALVLIGGAVAWRETATPARIAWEPAALQGLPAERARDLVLQQEEPGVVWASQGYSIYRSRDGAAFEKVFTVVPRFGEAWAGFSRTLRSRFGYQELVEVVPVRQDLLVAFAGGDVYRVDLAHGTQERTHRLRYFGRGEGRGLMPHGVTRDARGTLYYGEYVTAPGRESRPIGIWRSEDEGRTWTLVFEFPPGAVRHVHAVQWDPVQGGVWVGTGDGDSESRVGFSLDQARSFRWVGEGSQELRVCSFLFLPAAVLWGMDADRSPNHALRWLRDAQRVEAIPGSNLPGPTYYAQRVRPSGGILGLAELDAALFWLPAEGVPTKLVQWTMPTPRRPGPHPAVRLARGEPSSPSFVDVNPLRTAQDEAAIYRIPTERVLEHVGAARD